MFLHLGGDRVVGLREVISIGDCTTFLDDPHKKFDINREFLERMHSEGKVIDDSDKKPKSFVVTEDKIYLSAISSITLKRCASMIFDIDMKK